jgi:hypothetical protein
MVVLLRLRPKCSAVLLLVMKLFWIKWCRYFQLGWHAISTLKRHAWSWVSYNIIGRIKEIYYL